MELLDVKQLTTFIRTPIWITPGFGEEHAGPGGTNFACKYARALSPEFEYLIPFQFLKSRRRTSGMIQRDTWRTANN